MIGQRFFRGSIDDAKFFNAAMVIDGEANAEMVADILLRQAKKGADETDHPMRQLISR